MKKSIILIAVCLFFGASSWAQNSEVLSGVYTRDSLKAYLDGQSDGFLLKTSSSTFIINVGSRFYQCKQVAELATRGKAFNQEMFQNALAQMNTTSFDAEEVKEFKIWGEYFTQANTTFKEMSTDDFLKFATQCSHYGLYKGEFKCDEVSVLFINEIKLLAVKNSKQTNMPFKELNVLSKANDVSIAPGYAVKVIPNTYTISMK